MSQATLKEKLDALKKTQGVTMPELFPDHFMRTFTEFASIQDMVNAAGIFAQEEFAGEVWSDFVAAHSKFAGWNAMKEKAVAEWCRRKLAMKQ